MASAIGMVPSRTTNPVLFGFSFFGFFCAPLARATSGSYWPTRYERKRNDGLGATPTRPGLGPGHVDFFAETRYSNNSFFDDRFLMAFTETCSNLAFSNSAAKMRSTGRRTS